MKKSDKSGVGNGLILATIGGFGLIISQLCPIEPIYTYGYIIIGSIFTVLELLKESKYEKLFRRCGLVNVDGQVPLVIKKTQNGNTKTLVIHMPEGISMKHFEKVQEELEQALNCKIEFGFNKKLVMKCIEMSLKTMYPFEYEECGNPLEIFCGYSHEGKYYLDIEKCPHLIIAGETGSGKSSLLDIIVLSLLLSRHNVELHLVDFQGVGLGKYENCKKVMSYGETPDDFEKLLNEMDEESQRRLKLFRSVKNRIHIDKLSAWNEHYPGRALPYKVVIIDEFSRLSEKDYEDLLERFRTRVSMDRKVGIHYIISMQRPDVKCIEGSIKANMPTRIAFKTVTEVDSKVILDIEGAEQIKNPGRFLIKYCGEITEVQSMHIPSDKIMKFLRKNNLLRSQREIEVFELEKRRKHIEEWRKIHPNPYGVQVK